VEDRLARRVEFELYSTRAVPLKNVQIRSQDGTVILTGGVGTGGQQPERTGGDGRPLADALQVQSRR